jgi:hypothetical protein
VSEFVYLFRTQESEHRERMGTPQQAQEMMKAWLSWMRELESKGHLKERGQPLELTGKVVRGNKKPISDGPYAEAKDLVCGYIVVQAKDLAEAAEIAKGCPILAGEGAVEVRPILKANF